MIAVTGHRPDKLGGYKEPNLIKEYVVRELDTAIAIAFNKGERDFMSGMALGVDQWFAELVLRCGCRLHCAIPFASQPSIWRQEQQVYYYDLISRAISQGGSVTHVNKDPYAAWKLQARNIYMVDNSEGLIAVWDRSPGGTANCVAYAQKQNKPIYCINPLTRKTGML